MSVVRDQGSGIRDQGSGIRKLKMTVEREGNIANELHLAMMMREKMGAWKLHRVLKHG